MRSCTSAKTSLEEILMKKIIAFAIALIMLVTALAGCTQIKEDGKGATIDVYMGTKTINLDPAKAYTDENSVKILSLLFEGLFTLDANGAVKKSSITDKYEKGVDRHGNNTLTVWLKDTYWSDGSSVQANDFVYAWKRILQPEFKSDAAVLLYAIKGAKDAKSGKTGIDDIGLVSLSSVKIQITFENGADIDEFICNLASPALVPLRENKVEPYADTWSYSNRDLSTNGPFRVRQFTGVTSNGEVNTSSEIILERSSFYLLDQKISTEAADKYVTPYRIVFHFGEVFDKTISYSADDEATDIVSLFNNKDLFYISNINGVSASVLNSKKLKYDKLASTYSYMFNTNNDLFKNAAVRQAFSVAIDRSYAAELVGAGSEAATGLIPSMVFNTNRGTSFRKSGGAAVSPSAQIDLAKQLLADAGINPSSYGRLQLLYRKDETNDNARSELASKEKLLATYVQSVWQELGFTITRREYNAKQYEDALNEGNYDIIGLDYQILSPYPFYTLAAFSTEYSGCVALDDGGSYVSSAGMSGYSSKTYDELIARAFEATNKKEKASILHEAEKLLLEEGGIVPVIFNCDCYMTSNLLSGLETNYFGAKIFTKAKLKNYYYYNYTKKEEEAAALLPEEEQ